VSQGNGKVPCMQLSLASRKVSWSRDGGVFGREPEIELCESIATVKGEELFQKAPRSEVNYALMSTNVRILLLKAGTEPCKPVELSSRYSRCREAEGELQRVGKVPWIAVACKSRDLSFESAPCAAQLSGNVPEMLLPDKSRYSRGTRAVLLPQLLCNVPDSKLPDKVRLYKLGKVSGSLQPSGTVPVNIL